MLFAISKILKTMLNGMSMFLDKIIYSLISTVYQVFIAVSKASLYGNVDDKINKLTERIYVILGIAMLFVMAYNIILLIINPDKSSGDKSVQGLFKNFVISIVVLTLLPTIFNYMNILQNDIIDSHVIEKVILGDSDSNGGSLKNMGSNIATMIYSTFYHPIDENENAVSYEDCKSNSGASASCADYVSAYDNGKNGKVSAFIDDAKLEDALNSKTPTMELLALISTACGVVALLMFVSYAFDIGIRVAKLAFLQIIAPVPVILRITKPSGGVFSKWTSKLIETYLTLFLRLITIYFSMYMISLLAEGFGSTNGGIFANAGSMSAIVGLFARLVLIVGVLLFAKEAPKLLEELMGSTMKGGGFMPKDIGKKLTGAPLIGGALGAAGALAGKGIGAATGAAGAATSSLMNNIHGKKGVHMDTKTAMQQGAAQGWKKGGNQFNKQKQKVYQDTYGYDKKQGILGGKSINDKIDEKWGKAYSKNLKEDAAMQNEAYLNNKLAGEMPRTAADVGTKATGYATKNGEYQASSDAFKKAAQFVDEEASRKGVTLSPKERNAKINERLSQMAATTTNANEKRAIDSYLKRDSIDEMYNASILTGNQDAVAKVNSDARNETMSIVKNEIASKGIQNVITDANVRTTLESNARVEAATKISQVGGDFTKLDLSDQAKSDITNMIKSRVEENIQRSGGTANIQLTADNESRLQAQINEIKQNNPDLQQVEITNIETKLRDEAVRTQEANSIKNQVVNDYMVNVEYQNQVENHLFNEKFDQVRTDVMEKAVQSATNEIAAQMKEYAEGLANGTFSNDVSGKLDAAYSERFVNNEKVHSDGVKTKSAQADTLEQLSKIIDYTKKNDGKLPDVNKDDKK